MRGPFIFERRMKILLIREVKKAAPMRERLWIIGCEWID
jgi:hypothetical protein